MPAYGRLALLFTVVAGLGLAGCSQGWGGFERDTLNPGPAKGATTEPSDPWRERVRIPSGERTLDAVRVMAPESCPGPKAAVLIFHGRGETVADWAQVQTRLRAACVSSVVFDYTGHGASSPGGNIARLNEDASAATAYFTASFADTANRCLLSHSMGASPMLDMAARTPSADCLVVASPFSSLKDMAVAGGLPRPIALFLTNPWDNVRAASRTRARLLWVHSTSDAVLPIAMGRRVFDAAAGPKTAVTVSGFDHNAIYVATPDAIWNPILDFVRAPGGPGGT